MSTGDGFRLRPAAGGDLGYLTGLAASDAVEPDLAGVSSWRAEDVLAVVRRAGAGAATRLLPEVEDRGGWRALGGLARAVQNRRSRIARPYGVMLDPPAPGPAGRPVRFAAARLIRDQDRHRAQLEVYALDASALRLLERAGFVREGAKRSAYLRRGARQDGVRFGPPPEELAGRAEAARCGPGRAGAGRRGRPVGSHES